jgi:hypothetical protein
MRPSRLLLLVLASALLGLGAGQVRNGATLRGPASGYWNLPGSEDGFVLGTLDAIEGTALYSIQASLVAFGVACPACVAGEVRGALDDGLGPGPDYLVEGYYSGTVVNDGGVGEFEAILRTPGGARVGSLHGRFFDPGGRAGPAGSFRARWALRR